MSNVKEWPVFGMRRQDKEQNLLDELQRLSDWHHGACPQYRTIVDRFGFRRTVRRLDEVPFLPVRLFKHERLLSVPQADIVKTMTSSGTSGQSVSQIFLDKETSALQVRVLSRIVGEFIGPQRLPLLVIDCRATVADRDRFSARTAGVLGFSIFGREVEFALNDDMTLDVERIQRFLDKYRDQNILLFGFTFIVWQHFVQALEALDITLPLGRGLLIHGGGWKQLQTHAVSHAEFRRRLDAVAGLKRVHNYYGMVEQTGSIFMECEHGHLHTSSWSDVIVRDPVDFSPLPAGKRGLIQLLSVIPRSYPGHSLLSEDLGEIVGVDDCACGRMGTYFNVHGRIQNAETRGCSDTYSR
ncbi:LuxE/PaaK family acyltransferase [Paraburkholderia metrosideri]|uniref:Acyl-protein synthetase LuxE domain-containing protein n=1 Tax=Paraburkholderia metrosideri TaxID=580937 RepID=A0ABM8NRS9_9BURK|nr:acyl-protein synthetase [Paraburkholderia metrosideri]CAD6540325.1 hypothetical protein LMG28140_03487 [Paraburkholderia metrosideri]